MHGIALILSTLSNLISIDAALPEGPAIMCIGVLPHDVSAGLGFKP